MNLLHLIVRQWRQRPGRTLLSILSVAIAVAAVLGMSIAQSAVRLGNQQLLQTIESRPSLDLLSVSGERFSRDEVPEIANLPGVTASFPVLSRATNSRVHGKKFRSILLGLPLDEPQAWQALALDSGTACREPN